MEEIVKIELPFFVNLLLLLILARVLGEIMEQFKQPAMIGEILAGIILGPSGFALIYYGHDLKVFAELGVFMLVISAGLEIDLDDVLNSAKGKNLIISLLAFFLPFGSGLVVGHLFDFDTKATLMIALCIAITALPVSVRILMDLGKLNTPIGQRIISVAIFDDITALMILGILLDVKDLKGDDYSTLYSSIGLTSLKVLGFILVLVLAYQMIKRATKDENFIRNHIDHMLGMLKGKESLFAMTFVFILIFASISQSVGLHFVVGSFFAAMLLNKKILGEHNFKTIEKTTSSISMGFLSPIFFTCIGLEFNIVSITDYSFLIAVLAVSFGTKIIGGYVGGRVNGLNHQESLTLGVGLNARGIMEIVIANIGLTNGLISVQVFSILVIMGVATTLSTPIILKRIFK